MSSQQHDTPPLIRVRIVDFHVTLSPPVRNLSSAYQPPVRYAATTFPPGELPRKVPVYRIFGSTPEGQSACVNVHGCWPYFFVEYPEERSLDPDSVLRYCNRLAFSLNAALATKRGKKGKEDYAKQAMHVASVLLVKGVPFYGYSIGYSYALKVSLVTPSHVRRAQEILKAGKVLQRKFKVFEAHLSAGLQFFIDFDLYGCAYAEIDGGYFRLPLPEGDPLDTSSELFTDLTVPEEHRHAPALSPALDSYQTLELDIFPYHIQNRRRLRPRYLHDQLTEYLHPELISNDRLVRSVRELWDEQERRRISLGLDPKTGMVPPTDERRSGLSQEDRSWKGGDWDASQRYWEALQSRIQAERKEKDFHRYTHENLGDPMTLDRARWDKFIMTTYESVEAGWPINEMSVRKPGAAQPTQVGIATASPIDHPSDMDGLALADDEPNPFEDIFMSQKPHSLDDQERRAIEDEMAAFAEEHPEIWEDEDEVREVFNGFEEAAGTEELPIEQDSDEDEDFSLHLTQLHHKRQAGNLLRTPTKRGRERSASPSPSRSVRGMAPRTPSRLNPYYSNGKTPGSKNANGSSVNRFAERRVHSPTPARSVTDGVLLDHPADSDVSRSEYEDDGFSDALHALDRNDSAFYGQSESVVATASPTLVVERHNGVTFAPEPISPLANRRLKRVHMEDDIVLEPTLPATQYSPPAAQNRIITSDPPTSTKTQKRVRIDGPDASPAVSLAPTLSAESIMESDKAPLVIPLIASQSLDSIRSSETSDKRFTDVNAWRFSTEPPTRKQVISSISPEVVHPDPFFSDQRDVTGRTMQFGVRKFRLKHDGVEYLEHFEFWRGRREPAHSKRSGKKTEWTYAAPPPPRITLLRYEAIELRARRKQEMDTRAKLASQLGAPTQLNKYGYKLDRKKRVGKNTQRDNQPMTCFTMEIFATQKGRLLADPKTDPIHGIFYCYHDEEADIETYPGTTAYHTGMLLLDGEAVKEGRVSIEGVMIERCDGELDLINGLIEKVKFWNPDVLAGWDVHNGSWGYVWQRARSEFGMSLTDELSRLRISVWLPGGDAEYNGRHTTNLQTCGRQMFNIWRIFRGEFNLTSYTFENLAFEVLHQRIPHYSPRTLTDWYRSQHPEHLDRVLRYFIDKVNMCMEMLEAAETITKTAEFARVFGVDFSSVLKRGSQYKVESFMFRIAKPESFLLISPSHEEVGKQNAAEAQPLIFEPDSQFYKDPVIVLDFQSLYPSIMIGYNYCYSTCLGRVERFKGVQKLGWEEVRLPPGMLELLQDDITISPNGVMFAKQKLRKSLLAKMLSEILDTRVMVKEAMKLAKGDEGLRQVLNARQLGLKLMANVTYGYTGASFSGRMPCVEIADAIVQTGRETLEKAIAQIHAEPRWAAKVVYGDTDSVFVHLPGRSKEEAFRIGYEMAEAITAVNPKPVKLKFEKVYTKCLLMAKKRYVGFKYESIDEKNPTLDAKGIEIIRRDGFPAMQKVEETVLKMLFRHQNVSEIKRYMVNEWSKMLEGKVSIQDFVVAQEVKLGSYSEKGPPPAGAMVAARKLAEDPNDEAAYGARVPIVFVQHDTKHRLVDKAVSPEDLLNDRTLQLDMPTYIRKMIAPLNRILNLIGVDCQPWFDGMSKKQLANSHFRSIATSRTDQTMQSGRGRTLDRHFTSVHCLVCGQQTPKGDICERCATLSLDVSAHTLLSRYHLAQSRLVSAQRICASCSTTPLAEEIKCDSIDCPVLMARTKAGWQADDVSGIPKLVDRLEAKQMRQHQHEEDDDDDLEVIEVM